MASRRFGAVLVGGVADIVLTNIFAIPMLVYLMISQDILTLTPDQQTAALTTALQAQPALQISSWILGLSATIFGGYIAACLAREDEVRVGALSAWLCMAIGVYSLVAGTDSVPLWQHLLAFVAAPTFGALGGRVRRAHARKAHPLNLEAAT